MEKISHQATLVYPWRENNGVPEILLGRKLKKVLIGRLNGWGGKLEPGELPEAAAVRELLQEANLEAKAENLEKVAEIYFYHRDTDDFYVYVYLLRHFSGQPKADDGMADAEWYPVAALPFDQMAPADNLWLPDVLAGRKIIASIWYGPKQETLECEPFISYVDALP